MKRAILVFLLWSLAGYTALTLSHLKTASTATRPPDDVPRSFSVFLLRLLGLRRVAAGFLWAQFDIDSANVSASYHRLLPLLDAITALVPDDHDAWDLKTYMRLRRGLRQGNQAMIDRAIREVKATADRYPEDWEFQMIVAQQLFVQLGSASQALPYIERAIRLPGHHLRADKLHVYILKALGRHREALERVEHMLNHPELGEADRQVLNRLREFFRDQ